jgi:hypothetical protein
MSAISRAITPNPQTNLMNVCIYIHRLQIKWGFNQKKKKEEEKVINKYSYPGIGGF